MQQKLQDSAQLTRAVYLAAKAAQDTFAEVSVVVVVAAAAAAAAASEREQCVKEQHSADRVKEEIRRLSVRYSLLPAFEPLLHSQRSQHQYFASGRLSQIPFFAKVEAEVDEEHCLMEEAGLALSLQVVGKDSTLQTK